jgi:hypothetical protein
MAIEIKRSEQIGAILFLILSGIVYYLSGTFPEGQGQTGPGSYPRVVVTLIAVFALFQLARSLYAGESTVHEIRAPTIKRVGIVVALVVAYVITMPYLGFLVGTVAFLAVTIHYSGERNLRQIALVSVLVPIVLHYAFGAFLRVRLPENVLLPISRLLPPLPLVIGGIS